MDFRTIAAIVAGVVVLGCLALWLGRGLRIRKGPEGISFETSAAEDLPGRSEISVGEELRIEDATTGDITGLEGMDNEASEPDGRIDVLKKAVIKGSHVGNISGHRRLPKKAHGE